MRKCSIAAIVVLMLCMCGSSGAGEAPQSSWDRYKTIVDKNVFSRNRGPRMRREMPVVTEEYRPERNIKLTGIVQQDGEYIAFLEDTRAQKTTRVRAGESVLSGRVKSIELDKIEYEAGDATTVVTIGERLDSSTAAVSAGGDTATAAAPATETVTQEAAPSGSTAGLEGAAAIMERLRQRRQKELGQ